MTAGGDLAHEVRMAIGHVTHHEERAPHRSQLEEVEDRSSDLGETLGLFGGLAMVFEVECERDRPGHQ